MSFLARKPADSASAVPDAGSIDTSALTHLREHDYGPSLMDRAQRQRQALAGIGAGTQTLLLQAATSPLPHEAQLAALDRQSAQLADAERTQAGYRRLRERYDPGELGRSLQQVGAIADPVKQRESLTRLQASYATFAFHPELARRIDAQFAEFEPVVQRREDAGLRAAILAGRYAPTLADARQHYPGRKINTLFAPGSNTPVFVPERFADPDLEAEAVQVIQNAYHLAKVTGRRAHLEAALDDPAVRQVSRIPGNRASVVFGQRLESLSAPMPQPAAADPEVSSAEPPNADAHTLEAIRRGIVDAKTTLYGPLSKKEAERINTYLGTHTQIANANAGIATGLAATAVGMGATGGWPALANGLAQKAGILGSGLAGYGMDLAGPYPSRTEVRAGDVLALTSSNTYLRKGAAIPLGSRMDVRVINNADTPFVNDTGLTHFPAGTSAALLYETSSKIPAGTNPGVRLYRDDKGVIRFEPIPVSGERPARGDAQAVQAGQPSSTSVVTQSVAAPTVSQPAQSTASSPSPALELSSGAAGANPAATPGPSAEKVRVYVWNRKGTSPGHVMVTNEKGTHSWLSQFPHRSGGDHDTGRAGDNYRLSPRETFREEDRAPDGVYEVTLPKADAFRAKVRDHAVTRSNWDSFPRDSSAETHCAYSSYEALVAGGLPLPANTDEILLPGTINDYLRALAENSQVIAGSGATVKPVGRRPAP